MNERLEKVLQHPLHQHLGIEFIDSEKGIGRLGITVGGNNLNPAGALHGGVVYLLSDVCAYSGLLSLLDDTTEAVTHDIQVSVLRGAAPGDRVEFRSEVVKLGRSLCFIDVKASVADKVIALARVTKSLVRS